MYMAHGAPFEKASTTNSNQLEILIYHLQGESSLHSIFISDKVIQCANVKTAHPIRIKSTAHSKPTHLIHFEDLRFWALFGRDLVVNEMELK